MKKTERTGEEEKRLILVFFLFLARSGSGSGKCFIGLSKA